MNQPGEVEQHSYPPDVALSSSSLFRFIPNPTLTRVGLGFTTFVGLVEVIRLSGLPNTSIPFNYPFYLDIILVFVALKILKRVHDQLDNTKEELIILARLSKNRDNIDSDTVPDEEEIRQAFETRLDRGFDLFRMGVGGFILGGIVLIVIYLTGVTNSYPYMIMNFLFGASHGILLTPFFFNVALLRIVPAQFMNDINIIDPKGVGGYPAVGETIAKGAWYGILIINLDFLILGSVAFQKNVVFQVIVLLLYIFEIIMLLGFTAGSALHIRQHLVKIRDNRIRQLQWNLGINEGRFLSDRKPRTERLEEMVEVITYIQLFERLDDMNLWPVNLTWWTRFLGGVIATFTVIAIQAILVIDVRLVIRFLQEILS